MTLYSALSYARKDVGVEELVEAVSELGKDIEMSSAVLFPRLVREHPELFDLDRLPPHCQHLAGETE